MIAELRMPVTVTLASPSDAMIMLQHVHAPVPHTRDRVRVYEIASLGVVVGSMRVAEIYPSVGFVCWIQARLRRAGIGEALMHRAMDDHAILACEDFSSAKNKALWVRLIRQGWRFSTPDARGVGARSSAGHEIRNFHTIRRTP